MEFAVGPVVVAGEGWPDAWVTSATTSFAQATSPADITLHFDGTGLRPEELGNAGIAERLVEMNRSGSERWNLWSPGVFSGVLDFSIRRMTVRVGSAAPEPEIALNNPLRALVATSLPLHHDGLMLHAASAAVDGQGVAFAGVSTAGKTTLARGFKRATYFSDDVTLLAGLSRHPTLLSSPFFGAAGRAGTRGDSAPLKAVGILAEKILGPDGSSTFEPLSRPRAAAELVRHVARFTKDAELSARLLDLVAELVERVPVVLVRRSLNDRSDDVAAALLRSAGC